MFCNKCGKQIPDDSRFCSACGAPIVAPKVEEPKAEELKAEEPKAEEPKPEEPKAEEPKAEETKVEEPKAEESQTEEYKAEEPEAEEHQAVEPKAEASQAGASGFKYCVKCGNKMDASERFCAKCGADNKTQDSADGSGAGNNSTDYSSSYNGNYNNGNNGNSNYNSSYNGRQYAKQPGNAQASQLKEKFQQFSDKIKTNPEFKKTVTIIGGAVAAFIVLILIMSLALKPTINLNKYAEITFDGYESVGTASVTFDNEKFEKDYGSKLVKRLKKNARKSDASEQISTLMALYDGSASDLFLDSCVNYSLDKSTGLSNGDKVTMTWNCEDEAVKELFGYKLKYKDEEAKVKGLQKAKKFDPFAGLEVGFSGTAPDGQAQITTPASVPEAGCFQYSIDKQQGLSNGDKVTVKITAYSGDVSTACIEQYGDVPSATTKEFTVDGLGSYITKTAEIPDATLKEMQGQAVDTYKSYAVNSYSDPESLSGMTYLGTYLITAKSSQSAYDCRNALFLVYKITTDINQEKDWFTAEYHGSTESYWYIEYKNLILASDKNIDYDITQYSVPDKTFNVSLGDGAWNGYYRGYQSLNALHTDVVTGNSEKYKCEENIDANAAKTAVTDNGSDSQNGENADGNTDGNVSDADSGDTEGEIFPDSSDKLLSESDVEDLSKEDVRYAINEPYARHGYIFKDDELKKHFEQFDWYEGTESDDKVVYKEFNATEKKNVELLQKRRDELN